MCENGPPGSESLDPLQDQLEMGMSRVRFEAQAIHDPEVERVEHPESVGVETNDIGRICHCTEPVSGAGAAHAMLLLEGGHRKPADLEGSGQPPRHKKR